MENDIWNERETLLCALHEGEMHHRAKSVDDFLIKAALYGYPKRDVLLAIVAGDACTAKAPTFGDDMNTLYRWCLVLISKLCQVGAEDHISTLSLNGMPNMERAVLDALDYDLSHLQSTRLEFKRAHQRELEERYSCVGGHLCSSLIDVAVRVFHSFRYPLDCVIDTCMALTVFFMEGATNLEHFLARTSGSHLLEPCINLLHEGQHWGIAIDAKHILDTVSKMTELISAKIALVGASGVGKSSIVNRIVNGKGAHLSTESTIAAAYAQVTVDKYKLLIWDTAGSERFQSFLPMYLRGARVILAVYDVTNTQSLEYVASERKRLLDNGSVERDVVWLLVGNKTDVRESLHQVTHGAAQAVADSWVARSPWEELAGSAPPINQHYRVSAKTATNIGLVTSALVVALDSCELAAPHHDSTSVRLEIEAKKENSRTEKRCC